MPRPSKRQLAARAITATRLGKKARIRELGEVEEVVGAAIVEGVRATATARIKETFGSSRPQNTFLPQVSLRVESS